MKALILALLVLAPLQSLAATMAEVFPVSYKSDYEWAKCGENITRLVKRASQAGIDVTQGEVLYIENGGSSLFGLVRGEDTRAGTPRNWGFHVVLQLDGLIYDLDFTTSPKILPVAEYFEQMWLVSGPSQYDFEKVARDRKLDEYTVKMIPALEILSGNRTDNDKKVSLREYLKATLRR